MAACWRRVYKLPVQVVIDIQQLIGLAGFVEDLFPGVERFPDTRPFPKTARHAEGDIVDLPLELRILHHDHILPILSRQVIYVIFQVGKRTMPAGIIGQPDDIEGNLTLEHVIDEKMRLVILTTECDMQHDRTGGVDGFDAADAGIDQTRETVGMTDAPFRPDHSVIDLVADLDHVRDGVLRFKGGDGLFCKYIHRIHQRFEIESAPGSGFELFAGVGPVVAIMEIEQQAQAGGFDAFGHGQGMGQVAETSAGGIAAVASGVIEDAETDIIKSVVFEDSDRVALPVVVGEMYAAGFELGEERDIGAEHFCDGPVGGRGRRGSGYGARVGSSGRCSSGCGARVGGRDRRAPRED